MPTQSILLRLLTHICTNVFMVQHWFSPHHRDIYVLCIFVWRVLLKNAFSCSSYAPILQNCCTCSHCALWRLTFDYWQNGCSFKCNFIIKSRSMEWSCIIYTKVCSPLDVKHFDFHLNREILNENYVRKIIRW